MKFPLNLNYDGKIVREMDPKASLSVHQIKCAKSGGRANAEAVSNVTLLVVFHIFPSSAMFAALGQETEGAPKMPWSYLVSISSQRNTQCMNTPVHRSHVITGD